jgi:glycosyltransferase involved in cell wall biosynthesis
VLVIGDRGRRKGWWDAMLAFHRAFGNGPDVRLIVKSRGEPMRVTNPNVEYVTGDLTEEELRDLYHQAHVMLFPGREGYGLPPREFAATGGVALALDWGGTRDDIGRWGFRLDVSHHEVAFQDHPHFGGQVGTWAVADVDAMAQALQTVRDWYPYYAGQAMRNAAWVADHYRWSSFAAAAWDIYHEAVAEVQRARNVS